MRSTGLPAPGEYYDRPLALECAHYRADECRSCALLPLSSSEQLGRAQTRALRLLPQPGIEWSPPVRSTPGGFRHKAKMVVSGTSARPVLGLAGHPAGADLRDCPLYPPETTAALEQVAWFITRAAIPPYQVDRRRGELKHVLLTQTGPDEPGAPVRFMLRFVLRSEAALPRIREHLPALAGRIRGLHVVSANIHPAHAATLEGDREILLSETESLPVRFDGLTFHVRPRSFLQTNPAVAAELYRQGARWAGGARSVWDLYCGIGPFALHIARGGAGEVVGIETSPEAIASARRTAAEAGIAARFEVADATAWALAQPASPDLVVVNPPRRGIGADLAGWLDAADVPAVLYSSCNPASLARDLALMPRLRPVRARLFEMFPHTEHSELLVLLRRDA